MQGHKPTSQQRLNLFPVQDLDKLSDEELEILQRMAGVFAGQAGDGALGSRCVGVGGSQLAEFRRGSLVGACHGVGLFEGTRLKGERSPRPADRRFRRQGAVLESPGPKPGAMFLWERDGLISHLGISG